MGDGAYSAVGGYVWCRGLGMAMAAVVIGAAEAENPIPNNLPGRKKKKEDGKVNH